MKKTANELIAAFATGQTPSGDDFKALITAAYNVPDIEIYDSSGTVSAPFKMVVGKTTVTTWNGDFSVNFDHVGFSDILFSQATPLHEAIVINDIHYLMSATFTELTMTGAKGRAFKAGDSSNVSDGNYKNAFASPGDIIQYMIIGR